MKIKTKTRTIKTKTRTIKERKGIKLQENVKHDYYSFINKPWINKHISNIEINIFTEMQDHVNEDLIRLVKQSKSLKKIYDSFLHTKDETVKQTVLDIISKLDEYTSKPFGFYPFLAWMKRQGFLTPIHCDVEEDPKNNAFNIFTLEGGKIGGDYNSIFTLDNKEAYKNPKIKQELLHHYHTLFSIVLGNSFPYNLLHIYEREKSLLQKTINVVDTINMSKIYHKYTPKQLNTICHFDIEEFARELDIPTPSHILVQNPHYIRYTMHLLKTWNEETWRPFWIYQIIKMASHFHEKIFLERHSFLSRFYNTNPETTKEKRSLAFVKLIGNTKINKLYLASYKYDKERNYAQRMIYIIKKVLKDHIQKNSWMHARTKQHAIEKLDAMDFVVGYNAEFEPDPDVTFFSPDNAFQTLLGYNEEMMRIQCNKIDKRVAPNTVWLRDDDLNTFDVNAYYTVNRNQLILPNAILSQPFTDIKKPASFNFALLGTTIGHEMMHAFDNDGYQYDKTGNYEIEWTPEDKKKYKAKQESVKKQYKEFARRDHYKIPAELNMGENIADISGFLIAEDALCHYLYTEKATKEEINKSLHDFYVFYAKQWRSTLQAREMRGKIDNNAHTIAKYRVNCVLSRSKRFQELYGVQKGDGMYYDTTDQIW